MMFKKSFLISLILFFTAVAVDFFWKMNTTIGEGTHINRGFIFGKLQDLPASLTLVTLSSIGGLLIFVYILLITLLPSKLLLLKAGLGLLAGGILGNVIDRAIHGGTMDFIPMKLPYLPPIIFNPADTLQWTGALMIAYSLIVNGKVIWHPSNQRKFTLINPKEQIKFALKFAALALCTSLVLGLFSLSYLTLTLQSINIASKSSIISFLIGYIAITFFLTLLAFLVGLLLSRRIAGPIYAFEKYVDDLLKGSERELRLREGDSFKHLETVATNLRQHLKKIKN